MKKIIDVESNVKAQKYSAYRKKLNMINIDTYAGMMNFVSKYHLIYKEDFDKAKAELEEKNNSLTAEIRKAYSELNELEADVKQFRKYFENKEIHQEYITTKDKDRKFELSDFNKKYESAIIYFKKNDIPLSKVTMKNLQQKIRRAEELEAHIESLKGERTNVKNDIKKLAIIRQNNSKIFGGELSGNEISENKNHNIESQR